MSTDVIPRLIDDLDETLDAQGYVPLYDFSWTLRGYGLGLDEPQVEDLCRRGYAEFTRGRTLRLVWSGWPIDLDGAISVEPGAPLDFDIDSSGSMSSPLQVLVSDG